MKYCPNCGKQLPEGARFCTNCGHRLTTGSASQPTEHSSRSQASTPHVSRAVIVDSRKKHHRHWGWVLVIILLIAVAGFWFYNNNGDDGGTAAPASSSSASQSSTTDSASDTPSASSSTVDNSSSSADKLTTGIGPKNTAAAVTYYAAKSGVSHWSGVLNTADGITVQLSTDKDLLNALSEPGQGMAYRVYGYHDVDSTDDTDFVYTVDRDDTIHIYTLPNDLDSDRTYEPKATVSKQDMVSYLNDHDYAENVTELGNKVDIDR